MAQLRRTATLMSGNLAALQGNVRLLKHTAELTMSAGRSRGGLRGATAK